MFNFLEAPVCTHVNNSYITKAVAGMSSVLLDAETLEVAVMLVANDLCTYCVRTLSSCM